MLPRAWDGWNKMHVNPFAAMGFYFSSSIASIVTVVYLVTALPLNRSIQCYLVTGPLLLIIVQTFGLMSTFWRCGPQVVHHRFYPLCVVVYGVCFLPTIYVLYIGPQSTVPWDNRFKAIAVGVI